MLPSNAPHPPPQSTEKPLSKLEAFSKMCLWAGTGGCALAALIPLSVIAILFIWLLVSIFRSSDERPSGETQPPASVSASPAEDDHPITAADAEESGADSWENYIAKRKDEKSRLNEERDLFYKRLRDGRAKAKAILKTSSAERAKNKQFARTVVIKGDDGAKAFSVKNRLWAKIGRNDWGAVTEEDYANPAIKSVLLLILAIEDEQTRQDHLEGR